MRRCLFRHFHDKAAVHAHPPGLVIRITTGRLQQIQRIVIQEQNANLFQDAHAGIVNRLHAFGIDRLGRVIKIGGGSLGKLVGQKRFLRRCLSTSAATARTLGRVCDGFGHGHLEG